MNIDFRGQTVLVTGATRGIGKQMAEDFARLGANLILTGTKPATRLPKSRGGFTNYHMVDFTDPKSFSAFLRELVAFKRIDVCVNNAGINATSGIDAVTDADVRNIIAVNLEAPFKVTRAVGRIMRRNRYGRIVNIASIWSVISKPKKSIYTASKFGIRGLTVATAVDLAPHVLVNSVSPGFVRTDMTRRMLGERGMREMAKRVPLGRLAKPEEIAKVVLFLASRENTYITGQNIVADGGFVVT